MTADLDWKMRAAADGLRRATEVVPAPAAPTGRHRRGRIAVAALLVAAVVAGSVLIWNDRDRADPKVTTGPAKSQVAPLVLDPPPDGTTEVSATDLPTAEEERLPGTMSISLYHGILAFDGNASVDLAVLQVEGDTLAGQGEPVTIRGHKGEAANEGPFGGPSVTWEETPGREITLASHTLDTSILMGIAEGLRVVDTAGEQTVSVDQLPDAVDGFRPMAVVNSVATGGWLTAPRGAKGHMISYARADDDLVLLSTAVVDPSNLIVLSWVIDGKLTWTGDRLVHLGSLPAAPGKPPCVAAIWDRHDGTVGYLVATDLDGAAVLQLVKDNVREAGPEEWQTLVAETDR